VSPKESIGPDFPTGKPAFYRGEYFASDTPPLRSAVVGLAFARSLRKGSAWRLGVSGGLGVLMPELEALDGTELEGSYAGCLTAGGFVARRWSLVPTGIEAQSALMFGLRARLSGGVGFESLFANAALLADFEFQ
jgi:hypothetical protein